MLAQLNEPRGGMGWVNVNSLSVETKNPATCFVTGFSDFG